MGQNNNYQNVYKKVNAWERVSKRKSSYTAGGIVNWDNPYGEQNRGSLKN